MTFCLDSVMVKPEVNKKIKNAIILLHGYGGDGKDISMLSLNWKRHLPNTIFICPNGHEPCSINPNGYQWFDLSKDDPEYILDQSIKAEKKLSKFIDEIKKEFHFENNTSQLIRNITTEVAAFSNIIGSIIFLIADICIAIAIGFILLYLNWLSSLVIILFMGIFGFSFFFIWKKKGKCRGIFNFFKTVCNYGKSRTANFANTCNVTRST